MKVGAKGENIFANMDMNNMFYLWHLKFGHLNFNSLKLSHEFIDGFPLIKDPKSICEPCILGKQAR